jgi:FkbM family methyltransferase
MRSMKRAPRGAQGANVLQTRARSMEGLKNRIGQLLPEAMKAAIRPLYQATRRLLPGRPTIDSPSMLAIETIDGFEIAYRKGTADELVLKDSFSHDIFYSGVPEYQAAEDDVIIDIGAHIGTFSILSASKVSRGKVYAIEACRDTFNMLRINVALNGLANVSVHHLAITDKDGQVTLYYDTGNWGHSVVKAMSACSEIVESTTLSHFLEQNQIESCQFIKFNCEGAEFPILLSTPPKVLGRFGTILVLYHCDLWGKNTEADLLSRLESAGFKCVTRNQTEQRGWIIATNTDRAHELDGLLA